MGDAQKIAVEFVTEGYPVVDHAVALQPLNEAPVAADALFNARLLDRGNAFP